MRFVLRFLIGCLIGAPSLVALASPAQQVAGSDFIFIVRADGSVLGYGRDDGNYGAMQAPGPGIVKPVPIALPGKVRQMAAGASTHYALLEDGRLLAWGGANDRGSFGQGPGSSRTPENPLRSESPIAVPVPPDLVSIKAAAAYALALRQDGSVLTWGEMPGRSDNETRVRPIAGLADVVAIAAGGDHAMALARDGTVYAWGENKNGQLGADPATLRRSAAPVPVQGLDQVVAIACEGTTNFGFSAAVRKDGSVWMWGSNQSATLGVEKFWGNGGPPGSINFTPARVKGIAGATGIAVGGGHVAVLLADRTLRLWGHDGFGQIGVGTHGFYQPLPKKPAIGDVVAMHLVGMRSYAIKADGSVWWWGAAPVARAGTPLGRDQYVPSPVALP